MCVTIFYKIICFSVEHRVLANNSGHDTNTASGHIALYRNTDEEHLCIYVKDWSKEYCKLCIYITR